MAHCDEYIELISAAVDGALSPAEQERLEEHLALCPECKALYEDLTALHAALGDLPPVEVPADLTDRIMAAVAGEQVLPFAPVEKRRSPIRWQRWLASAAVLAVVLMGTWSWKPWERNVAGAPESAAPAAPAVQQNMTTDSSEPVPEASEAVEAASESVLLYTAGSEAPAPVFPVGGKSAAKAGADALEDAALPTADKDIPAETPEEKGKIAPQMFRMAPEPESVVNGGDGGVDPAMPTEVPEGIEESDLEEALPAPQHFMVTSMLASNGAADRAEMTAQEALDLVAEYVWPGVEMEKSYSEGEAGPSCTVTCPDGSGGTLTFDGESEDGRYNIFLQPNGNEASLVLWLYQVDKAAGTVFPLFAPENGSP